MADPFLGQIILVGFNFAPRGWALCQGQILPINQNQSLYSLLGTTYGGDGRTTFALPDLRGRTAIHPGQNGVTLGQKSGQEQVTLTTAQIPAHTHTGSLLADPAVATTATPRSLASAPLYTDDPPNVALDANATLVTPTGGTVAHENMQPFLTVNYIIALQGTFPSRN